MIEFGSSGRIRTYNPSVNSLSIELVGTTTMLAVNFATDGLAALELRRLKDLLAI